jgi:hypothetical protein
LADLVAWVTRPSCHLLSGCRPPTVLRFVITVIVDSIKAGAFWACPHIRQEVLEGEPSVADRNASPAVTVVSDVLGIKAASLHGLPRLILGWTNTRNPVFFVAARTTCRSLPARQRMGVAESGTSAFADANPSALNATVRANAKYRKFAEFLINQVVCSAAHISHSSIRDWRMSSQTM